MRQPQVVRIQKGQPLPPGRGHPQVPGRGHPSAAGMAQYPEIPPGGQNLAGAIGPAIIHHHDLEVLVGLGFNRGHRLPHQVGPVVGGDDDADQGCHNGKRIKNGAKLKGSVVGWPESGSFMHQPHMTITVLGDKRCHKSRVKAANRRSMMPGFEKTNLFIKNIGLSYFISAGFPWGSRGCEFKMGARGSKPQLWTGTEGNVA